MQKGRLQNGLWLVAEAERRMGEVAINCNFIDKLARGGVILNASMQPRMSGTSLSPAHEY
jgi:hypothetical protein